MKVSPGEGRNAVPLGWFHVYFSALQNFVLGLLCLVMSGYWTGVDAHSAADQGCLTEAHWAPINHKVADAACEGFARCQAWRQQRFCKEKEGKIQSCSGGLLSPSIMVSWHHNCSYSQYVKHGIDSSLGNLLCI